MADDRFSPALLWPQQLIARTLRLPPPRNQIAIRRNIPVPMADGVSLLADHYGPRGLAPAPTILIRTPYGRGGETPFGPGFSLAELPARRFAERGYHVLVQGVRGRFGSGGVFTPHLDEAADGAATIAWLREQPWCDGRLGSWGPSYLGYAQWAAAAAAPGALGAMVPIVTSAEPFSVTFPDRAFALATRLRWAQSLTLLDAGPAALGGLPGAEGRLRRAFATLPLLEADRVATGRELPAYRAALSHEHPADPFWSARDHSAAVAGIMAPTHLIGGWHDYFLRPLLRDYATLLAAGREPQLTIGPWAHADPGVLVAGLREGLRWFDLHLRGEGLRPALPVALFVSGAEEWRGFAAFPPPATELRLHLHQGGRLAPERPTEGATPTSYRYDPADPTPNLGGALLGPGAGPRDARALEARADLRCFTSELLPAELELIGEVVLELFAASSLAYTDFVARLCEVWPDGRSIARCDGMIRLAPGVGEPGPDGSTRLEIRLGPLAHRFARGHRIRLQIASAAHPRWSRNLGTGEPIASGIRLQLAQQTLFHDGSRPSALILPQPREHGLPLKAPGEASAGPDRR